MRAIAGVIVACIAASCSFDGGSVGDVDATPDLIDAATADSTPAPDATPLSLIDRGLVLRYFMDEAGSGTVPIELIDSAPNPLNLPITYGQAVYVDDGNRGLYWQDALGSGKIEEALSATKLSTRLRNAMRVTMEIVVDIDGADDSQISGLRGSNPDFMLAAAGSNNLRFYRPFGTVGATWDGSNDQERMVLHVVFDPSREDAMRRIQLYKNGVLVPKTTSNPPVQNSGVGLGNGDDFMIGNSQGEAQSISGTIYYVAYYDLPLMPGEISNNYQRLFASDDK